MNKKSSIIPKQYIKALRIAWIRKQLTLFLGAGVSAEYGMPNSEKLLFKLIFGVPSKKISDLDRIREAIHIKPFQNPPDS